MYKNRTQCFKNLSLVLLIPIVLVYCGTPEQQQTSSSDEGFIQTEDGVELFYRISGSGPDTLIMLHGGPGLNFDYLAPDLTQLEEQFTLIYYDQRGAGRSTQVSEPDVLTIDSHLSDLESVRRYFELDKMTLFGHSWGAMLSSFYLLDHSDNVEKMVHASPGPPRFNPYLQQLVPNISAWMDDATRDEMIRLNAARQDTTISARESCTEFWKLFIRGYFSDPHNPDMIQNMQGDFCAGPEEALRNGGLVGTHTFESISDYDLRDRLSHIDLPVLIIAGTEDIFPSEAMHEWDTAFNNSKLVLIEKAGHYPQIEQPEFFFRTVTDFLIDE